MIMSHRIFSFSALFSILLLSSCAEVEEAELPQHQKWHTVTLSFAGPDTSEDAAKNPFLNYRLTVDFEHAETSYSVRGFYAADGDAAHSGADSGNIWQARFVPDRVGKWSYSARLEQGDSIAIWEVEGQGEPIELTDAEGKFKVVASDITGDDFRAHGRIVDGDGYFQFKDSGKYWLKGGANSPENLLAYADFDETYRMKSMKKDGEASTNDTLHAYRPHIKDWQQGDPEWKNGKGKGLIGAANYLASKGMNSVYFLTMNINGDGEDVWPYRSPDDFTRFDVSKLGQWEIVFDHMQSKGLLLQIVLQETENELLLDRGDTGPMRRLYLNEIIARFGHHLALNWNIGEEIGPAPFTPDAQNDAQRKAMISYLDKNDPYGHPIMLHTHAWDPPRKDILDPITGFKPLDGLSLQVGKRETVAETFRTWKELSQEKNHEWTIMMDEIGEWNVGAQPDSLDADHETLRGQVLWGSLLSGAGGVEWYFGANTKHNDLNVENWRTRDRLWELTDHALTFFRAHLPYWEMQADQEVVFGKEIHCFAKRGEVYAVYFPEPGGYELDLSEIDRKFSVNWYDPLTGGELQKGSIEIIEGGDIADLGTPPKKADETSGKLDWVALLKVVE